MVSTFLKWEWKPIPNFQKVNFDKMNFLRAQLELSWALFFLEYGINQFNL